MNHPEIVTNDVLVETLTWREHDILGKLAERHTNREIALALGIELTTVKWYNKQIFEKLGVSSRYQAVEKAKDYGLLEESSQSSESLDSKSNNNLPVQLTSFVGRQREITEIKNLLADVHLLTLTGPGGTGKTRLGLQVAAALVDQFNDGITFVDLAPIKQPDLVANTIARTLGIMVRAGQSPSDGLKKYFGNKKHLLVLDNFEHLVEAASLIGTLLSASPDLKVMITSREVLGLYGEQAYPVPPLGLPDGNKPATVTSLSDVEAIALFNHRARAVKPDFRFTEQNAPSVAEICTRLDGLPLAIELAAARLKLFSPGALLEELENRLSALHSGPRDLPARQRTLRDSLAWSYDLLDEGEQKLFARLSIFQGGCTPKTAVSICSHNLPIDVFEGLESLLNKNLLRLEEEVGCEPRFVMLGTIHEFAQEQLLSFGEMADIQKRHADYFTSHAEQSEPYTRGGPHQMHWLRQLESEHDNLRAAYIWAVGNDNHELGLRLVSSLDFFWYRQGHHNEGKHWTAWALEVVDDGPPALQADVFFTAGLVASFENDRDNSKNMYRKALAIYKELNSPVDVGWTQIYLSYMSVGIESEYEAALVMCEEGLSLLIEIDDKASVAQAHNVIGELSREHGDLVRAKDAYEKCLEIACEIGDKLREGIQYLNLGAISLRQGDFKQAQALAMKSLRFSDEIDLIIFTTDSLCSLAEVAEVQDYLEHAAVMFGAAERLYEIHGFGPQLSDAPRYERSKIRLQEKMDSRAYQAARIRGWNMSRVEAVAYALAETVSDP